MSITQSTKRQREIFEAWDIFEAADEDASTERLMQMVADRCGCDAGDVAQALYIVGKEKRRVKE